jgi:hypothetical protein
MNKNKSQASASKMAVYFLIGSAIMGANLFILGVAFQ